MARNTSILFIISVSATLANGFILTSHAKNLFSITASMTSTEIVEGYEYIHPHIAQMLIGDYLRYGDNDNSTEQSSLPFDVDSNTLTLQLKQQECASSGDECIMAIEQLQNLANHCDDIVFRMDARTLQVPKKILGLIHLSQLSITDDDSKSLETNSASITVASMVSVNLLESSIRSVLRRIRPQNNSNSHQTKGAPLLSNMVKELSMLDTNPMLEYNKPFPLALLSPVLKTLLLPTKAGGINLRNLLSHGFISTLDRRWFSLALVLIQTLDSVGCDNEAKIDTIDTKRDVTNLSNYDLMKREIDYGREVLSTKTRLQELEVASCSGELIPPSHINLFRFTLNDLGITCISSTSQQILHPLPTIFLTSMSSLLEHSIRLVWCRANNRMEDSIARPASYYVTLDGHGQKDKHDVMISPYLCDGCTKNKLVTTIGAPAFALLADLFASPASEAPNIRAAVCHGYFEDAIIGELTSLANGVPNESRSGLTDVSCALVSVFDLVSSNISGQTRIMTGYRPLFSYTSVVTRDLDDILDNLASLNLLIKMDDQVSSCIEEMEQQCSHIFEGMSQKVDMEKVQYIAHGLFKLDKINESEWRADDLYTEHNTNMILADCNAAQMLLADVSLASQRYVKSIKVGITRIKSLNPTSTKDRRAKKSLQRFCGVASLVFDFYCLISYIALFAIDYNKNSNTIYRGSGLSRAEVVKAVERSRMTLSTFDAYISTNLDRSIKSLAQYLQGKAVKKIVHTTIISTGTCNALNK